MQKIIIFIKIIVFCNMCAKLYDFKNSGNDCFHQAIRRFKITHLYFYKCINIKCTEEINNPIKTFSQFILNR